MGLNQIFHGKVQKGKLVLDAPMAYLKRLASFEGKSVELILRQHKSQRSDRQLRYYWAVIIEIIAQHIGYTTSEAHEALKLKFLSDHMPDHQGLIKIRSTSELSTAEFAKYCDEIVRWAAEHMDLFIPDPGQVDYQ